MLQLVHQHDPLAVRKMLCQMWDNKIQAPVPAVDVRHTPVKCWKLAVR